MELITAGTMLYGIIGINCIIVELGQFYRNHSLDVAGMLIWLTLWPLLLIMERRGLSIRLTLCDLAEERTCQKQNTCQEQKGGEEALRSHKTPSESSSEGMSQNRVSQARCRFCQVEKILAKISSTG
ncbi:MAG: hypothetical protein K6U11_00735 [bacterium]|nr:hypothetical protein [bacterium]